MIHEWKEFLDRKSSEWGIGESGEPWNFFLHNNYQPHYSNFHVLWFQKHTYPAVVTKVFPEIVLPEHEFSNLENVYACAPDWVPRPLGLYQIDTFWTLWMLGAQGKRLQPSDLSNAAIDRFCDTLSLIEKGMAARSMPNPRRYYDCIVDPLEAVTQQDTGMALSGHCARIRGNYTERWLESLPALPQHGDLYNDNIIVYGLRWKIIDWETLGRTDLPFYDLVCFLFSIEGGTPPLWSTTLQRYASRSIARYAGACGLEVTDFMLMLPLLLANWAQFLISAERKEIAIGALRDYFSRPDEWARSLTGAP